MEHPLLSSSSEVERQARGPDASPSPQLSPEERGATQQALETLANSQPNDRSRSHTKRKTGKSLRDRSESTTKKLKVNSKFFAEYEENSSVLLKMGLTLEKQLALEKGLNEEQIIAKQRKYVAYHENIHRGIPRGGSAPPPSGSGL